MAVRTILHVGTMKSGTSHIQSRLFRNQQALLEAGVLVPGKRWVDQARAVGDLLRIQRRGPARARGDWQRLSDEIAAHTGTAVISMEFLGPSTPAEIAGICAAAQNVEAIITTRDLNRSLAAMWQETVQNGSTYTYREYLASAEATRGGGSLAPDHLPAPGRGFWRQQGVVRMARDWSAEVPLTLITVPPPGAPRTILWDRFCQAIGVPATGWVDARRSNESIGAASAMVLRQVNEALATGVLPKPARRFRKQVMAKRVMSARKHDEPSIGLPVAPWVAEHSATMVADLQQVDLRLIGEWSDLRPVDVPGLDPEVLSGDELLGAAVAALAGIVRRCGQDVDEP